VLERVGERLRRHDVNSRCGSHGGKEGPTINLHIGILLRCGGAYRRSYQDSTGIS